MQCKQCGAPLPEGDLFCAQCGARQPQPPVKQPLSTEKKIGICVAAAGGVLLLVVLILLLVTKPGCTPKPSTNPSSAVISQLPSSSAPEPESLPDLPQRPKALIQHGYWTGGMVGEPYGEALDYDAQKLMESLSKDPPSFGIQFQEEFLANKSGSCLVYMDDGKQHVMYGTVESDSILLFMTIENNLYDSVYLELYPDGDRLTGTWSIEMTYGSVVRFDLEIAYESETKPEPDAPALPTGYWRGGMVGDPVFTGTDEEVEETREELEREPPVLGVYLTEALAAGETDFCEALLQDELPVTLHAAYDDGTLVLWSESDDINPLRLELRPVEDTLTGICRMELSETSRIEFEILLTYEGEAPPAEETPDTPIPLSVELLEGEWVSDLYSDGTVEYLIFHDDMTVELGGAEPTADGAKPSDWPDGWQITQSLQGLYSMVGSRLIVEWTGYDAMNTLHVTVHAQNRIEIQLDEEDATTCFTRID